MFLKKSISNGKTFLTIAQGYRINGKVRHKTIEKIGYLEDLEKIYDDPISHFKKIIKEKNETSQVDKKIQILKNLKLSDNSHIRKNLGYAIPKKIYTELDIKEFFQDKQKKLKIEYSLNDIFSLLVYSRILNPLSKKKTFENKENYFEAFDFSLDDTYRALSHFANYSNDLQKHLNKKVSSLIERKNNLGYYDVTNYYFEIPYNDTDIIDDNGNLIKKGFRKKGPSKEHRPDPIVQMGLLMDSNGLPMAFNTFSGGESEKTSLLPTIKRVKRDYELEKIIVVADRGLNTSDNITFLARQNNDDNTNNDGYVYGQSVLGADKEFKNWVLEEKDYIKTKEIDKNGKTVLFTHKSRVFAKTVTLKNNNGKRQNKFITYQKQMVYYSQKYADKQKKERELVLAKAKDLISNPSKYTKATSVGAAGYINNLKFVKKTGEIPDGLQLSLKLDKITEEEKYDGYYSIITSEKHLSDKEIRDIYKGLWEIEESFKIIKSEFSARPIFLKLENHIHAHFLICFVALLIFRLLEFKLNKKFPATQIRETLRNYCCSHIDENYYLFDFRNNIIKEIENIFNVDFSNKILTTSEIKKILKENKNI